MKSEKKVMISRILVLIPVFWLLLLLTTGCSVGKEIEGSYADSGQRPVVIIHTNDSHGRVIENEHEGIMGMAAVAALKKSYITQGYDVLLLDAGDTFHGLPIASLSRGEYVAELMNMAGYDGMTPGNHDFNYGSERLLELSVLVDFPVISSNVIVENTKETLLQSETVIEKNGKKYGIFGLTTPEVAYKTNPDNVTGLLFADPVEKASESVEKLTARKADLIIGLLHMGLDPSSTCTSETIAKEVSGIDLIIDGHSHTVLEDGIMEGQTMIVSAGEYLKEIGVVMIEADGTKMARLIRSADFKKRDAEVTAAGERMQIGVQALLEEPIGESEVLLDGSREAVRSRETNLGNLAADAVRGKAQEMGNVDAAFLTGGGFRSSISPGIVTKEDLFNVFPFGNQIIIKELSGRALKEAVEHGVADAPGESGAFPQVSGLWVVYDSSRAPGERVTSLKIGGDGRHGPEGAVDVKENGLYRIAVTDHVAAGGDQYLVFKQAADIWELGSLDQCLTWYFLQNHPVSASVEGRVTDEGGAEK